MMPRRTAVAVSLAGLFAGLLALPLSALLNPEPTTRTVKTAPSNAVVTARSSRPANVMVIAHRGFSDIAPENTVPAMRAAATAGADLVEFDIQRTADGHPS
ncbi:hypothetical protein CF8_4097 [Nocardioides sp. CF8]|uniref:glycerophosphodiester phosphodiesterase family protein n=1 Tax=Nocardioides sp. CF8 TaxID=110319 RepID=UPI00032F9CD7|nr:glycerophosphodiester phosphodiesterase family protein [Nocardioides sp. CF8]EON22064.1 hypothetical protein CF8_4097 [Nocardioides sp. CF8]